MIFWIILILITIAILFLLWWYIDSSADSSTHNIEDEFRPTIHAQCQSNSTCGGDMVCDLNCHRCRKQIGGDCANDVDCEFGLYCRNWKCSQDDPESSRIIEIKVPKKPGKSVRWADME